MPEADEGRSAMELWLQEGAMPGRGGLWDADPESFASLLE